MKRRETALFRRVAIIGLGLIGSSLALSMRRGNLAGHIAGVSRGKATRDKAAALALADSLHESAEEAVRDADLVVLCVPVGAMGSVFAPIASFVKEGAIVSDVGSVKGSVVEALLPLLPSGVFFVPAHPVAGTERSGPEAGFAELFDGRWCILTPLAGVPRGVVDRVRVFWELCGSRVAEMEVARHDRVLALTSHLPHLVAYAMTDMAASLEGGDRRDLVSYSAGGFRDFTRLAASDPVMWRDIFLGNREESLAMLDRFLSHLALLRDEVAGGDGESLRGRFVRARRVREKIVLEGQETGAVDFGRRSR